MPQDHRKTLQQIADQIEADLASPLMTDQATWDAARELTRRTQDLTDRLYAREVSGDQYQDEMLALLKAPEEVVRAATQITRTINKALRVPSDKAQS